MPYPFTFTVYDIVNLFGINVSMIVDMIRQCDVSNVVPVQRITHHCLTCMIGIKFLPLNVHVICAGGEDPAELHVSLTIAPSRDDAGPVTRTLSGSTVGDTRKTVSIVAVITRCNPEESNLERNNVSCQPLLSCSLKISLLFVYNL